MIIRILCSCVLLSLGIVGMASANPIDLMPPDQKGGKPLMETLTLRKTDRTFAATSLNAQQLSNLLYAAAGQNRTDGHLTYPTARDVKNMRVVVAMADGAYHYYPETHTIWRFSDTDLRPMLGEQQAYVKTAPVTLLYIADTSKAPEMWSAMHAGSMYQNAALYCASAGLHNSVRGLFPADKLAKELNLKKNEKIIITQTIGLPAK